MKKAQLSIFMIFYVFILNAQTFNKNADTITKSAKATVHKYTIKKNTLTPENSINYVVELKTDKSTTLSPLDYTINFKKIKLAELIAKEKIDIYFEIKEDTLEDRVRHLKLNLTLTDTVNKKSTITDTLSIVIKSANSLTTNDYQYLAYIGTNFDLVDGIETNNLFFAANIYLEPEPHKMGWYLSLYGNRSFTATDSTTTAIRDESMEKLNDTTALVYREHATMVRDMVSDNLGAHTSFLFNLVDLGNATKLLFAPAAEFIWRRTKTTSKFKDGVPLDTIQRIIRSTTPLLDTPNNYSTYSNEFSFSIGPGIILAHQTKTMSVRLHASAGYISEYEPHYKTLTSILDSNYNNTHDFYFAGRAWITEATSGVTLQAEVTNSFLTPRPFYTVTLSKAISFKNLGTIFSPVTARN